MAGQIFQALRSQIARWCNGDSQLIRQMEFLFTALNGDTVKPPTSKLAPNGTRQIVSAGVVPGTYSVELVAMLTVAGGGGSDGVNIGTQYSAPGIVSADANYAVVATTLTTAAAFAAPTDSTLLAFVPEDSVVRISGVLVVNFAGTIGFSFAVTGSPGSCQVLAGSGLTLVRIA